MDKWWWLLIGIFAGGAAGAALAMRLIRRARRSAARQPAAENLVELGQLAGGLAHEIKNPLSTINVNLKLLSEDIARLNDEEHHRWLRRLQSVQNETARIEGILNDFLNYAKKCELSLKEVDLNRLIGELADFFAPQAEAAHVVMRTTLPEKPIICRIDADLIKQALLNLMINAVDAMDGGGELILTLSSNDKCGLIEVIDTGCGIPPSELAKIFQAYYSTKAQGTGLGLPTMRRIVREHGGAVNVDSEPGKGTRFTISLPLVK